MLGWWALGAIYRKQVSMLVAEQESWTSRCKQRAAVKDSKTGQQGRKYVASSKHLSFCVGMEEGLKDGQGRNV